MSRLDTPSTVAIRNPAVLQRIAEELKHGAGRNATEAAENLILEEASRRRLERDRSRRVPEASQRSQPAA